MLVNIPYMEHMGMENPSKKMDDDWWGEDS